ncbi:MAG: ketosteroid isomerase-related protein [Syntrophaceae bacterium]
MTTRKSTWIIFGIFVISAWVLGSAIQAGAQTAAINDVVAAWNSHDTEKVVSFFTDDCVYEDLAFGQIKRGKEELRAFVNDTFAMVPDTNFEVKSSFISGDGYAVEWVWSGTHKGNLPWLPATGKRFSIRGVAVEELKEGKIKRHSDYYNLMDFLKQIGIKLVPAVRPK